MDKYVIGGGIPLAGSVEISGGKNAALPILAATILAQGPCTIDNIPNISDVKHTLMILREIGAQVRLINKTTVFIDTTNIGSTLVPYEQAKHMRASYYFLGALLGRYGHAEVSMPGGCDLGIRPIDRHIRGFQELGCTVSIEPGGMIHAKSDQLFGSHIFFDGVSVGATINVMLAAVQAEGITVLENVAKEPHVVDCANFLNLMGADIRGAGTDVIKIHGVKQMHGADYSIIPDQIEAGTYMIIAAATAGDIVVKNIIPKHLESVSEKLLKAGAGVEEYDDAIRVYRTGPVQKVSVKTLVHPGFPTDLQPQFTAMLTVANGTSIVTEDISDNRFKYAAELRRMGANIQVDGKVAVVEGVPFLTAAPVKATDLRAGAALVIAGLMTGGVTEVEEIHHIERGYENMVEKLQMIGADIRRISIPDSVVAQAR